MLESQLLALGIDGKWLEPLKETFEKYGINTEKRQAAFIGQCMHESGGFKLLEENLNYSAKALMNTWPSRFPNEEMANQYARNPEKIANKVYGGRMGNADESSGEGYEKSLEMAIADLKEEKRGGGNVNSNNFNGLTIHLNSYFYQKHYSLNQRFESLSHFF
jgi:hypothetical protein